MRTFAHQYRHRLMAVIERELPNPALNLRFLQREVGLSNTQLHRMTRQLFGLAPGELIRRERTRQAADLLKRRPTSITDIAYETGFSDPSYFTKLFKAHYGLSPLQYRCRNH